MSKCNRCNIKVKDDSLICPLCKGALSETEHVQPVYPDMFPKQQRMRLAIRIVTFCVVVGVVVLGIVNYMTYHGVRWSLVSLAGIAYLYFTFTFTAQPLADEQQKIIFQGVIKCQTQNIPFFTTGHRRNRGSRGDFPGTKIRNMSVFMPKMTMVSLFLRKKLHKFAQPT